MFKTSEKLSLAVCNFDEKNNFLTLKIFFVTFRNNASKHLRSIIAVSG